MTTANAAIEAAITEVEGRGLAVSTCHEGGYTVVIIDPYPVPAGWSRSEIHLLMKLPLSFPNGKLDMFWTDTDLVLASGAVAQNADVIEMICGRSWRRFSWHPTQWVPGRDDIHTFLEFVDRRLLQRR